MSNKESIGKRIKKIRRELGESQAEFGTHFSPAVDKGSISRWESGATKPRTKRLREIADLGGVSVDYLVNGNTLDINGLLRAAQNNKEADEKLSASLLKKMLDFKDENERLEGNKSQRIQLVKRIITYLDSYDANELDNLDLSLILSFLNLFHNVKNMRDSSSKEKLRSLLNSFNLLIGGYDLFDEGSEKKIQKQSADLYADLMKNSQ